MPANYNTGFKWLVDYLYGKTNLLGLSTESDVPGVLFPAFVTQQLLLNAPGISLDDLGTQVFNRRWQYARWADLPVPNFVTNETQVSVVAALNAATNVHASLANAKMFLTPELRPDKVNGYCVIAVMLMCLWVLCGSSGEPA